MARLFNLVLFVGILALDLVDFSLAESSRGYGILSGFLRIVLSLIHGTLDNLLEIDKWSSYERIYLINYKDFSQIH